MIFSVCALLVCQTTSWLMICYTIRADGGTAFVAILLWWTTKSVILVVHRIKGKKAGKAVYKRVENLVVQLNTLKTKTRVLSY